MTLYTPASPGVMALARQGLAHRCRTASAVAGPDVFGGVQAKNRVQGIDGHAVLLLQNIHGSDPEHRQSRWAAVFPTILRGHGPGSLRGPRALSQRFHTDGDEAAAVPYARPAQPRRRPRVDGTGAVLCLQRPASSTSGRSAKWGVRPGLASGCRASSGWVGPSHRCRTATMACLRSDHDALSSNRAQGMKTIDCNEIGHAVDQKPVPTFWHHARDHITMTRVPTFTRE